MPPYFNDFAVLFGLQLVRWQRTQKSAGYWQAARVSWHIVSPQQDVQLSVHRKIKIHIDGTEWLPRDPGGPPVGGSMR
jgi:hypothetical protein